MEAPLLERSSGSSELTGGNRDYVEARGVKSWWRIFCIESLKLWAIGGPIAFQILCQFGTNTVATIFVGHIGDVELSAFSIAISVVGIFASGLLMGMGSALETLCGQAFGAGQVHMLGVYMQRSIIILFATSILILPLYVYAPPILKLVGQPDEIAKPAGFYAFLIIPQKLSTSVTLPTQKFLQAQSKVSVLAWIAAVALLGQVLCCWLFVVVFGWGAAGAAVAYDVSGWFTAISQFVYVVGFCEDGWKGFSLNVNNMEGMMFTGLNAAISVRVSNELGLGHSRAAKYSVYVTLFQSLVIGIVCMVVVLATRNYIAVIFTDSPAMQQAVARLSGLLGISMLLNSIQPIILGVAVGGGWQGVVAYINLACYYLVGLPLGYVLGYVANFGVVGIWGGMIFGLVIETLVLVFILHRTNWNKEVEQSSKRMKKWGGIGS